MTFTICSPFQNGGLLKNGSTQWRREIWNGLHGSPPVTLSMPCVQCVQESWMLHRNEQSKFLPHP